MLTLFHRPHKFSAQLFGSNNKLGGRIYHNGNEFLIKQTGANIRPANHHKTNFILCFKNLIDNFFLRAGRYANVD